MRQTSGSIVLDTTGLTTAVLAGIEPILGQVNANLERLAGLISIRALSRAALADVLIAALPSYAVRDESLRSLMFNVTGNLCDAGYTLVPLSAPDHSPENVVTPVGPVTEPDEQTEREDRWFAPGREV